MCSTYIKSTKLPITCDAYIPKPSQDPTNKNCIIITTNNYDEDETTPGIYKYNLVSNESQIIYKYDDTFKSSDHGQFTDALNNTLILYGGDDEKLDDATFKIFDLNTNQMKQINDTNMLSKCSYCPQNT
eukprot:139799_1